MSHHVIWKWPLRLEVEQAIDVPEGSEVVHVATQKDVPALWMRVPDLDAPVTSRRIHIVGTGHQEVHPAWRYLGSVMTDGGVFVWHIFEGTEVSP